MKKNISKLLKINIISIYLIAVILTTMSFSVARYMNLVSGLMTLESSKFSFKLNENVDNNFVINLSETADANTNYDQTKSIIIPGSQGEFILELDAAEVETAFKYTIILSDSNNNLPHEMILYEKNSDKISIVNTPDSEGNLVKQKKINGQFNLSDLNADNKISHTIKWIWQVNPDKIESSYESKDLSIDIEIEIKQVY